MAEGTIYKLPSGGAGSANVASELLIGTQSGSDVTLDLSGLSHPFVQIFGVYRNGQKVTPNVTWTRSGSTITVFNASASNAFLIDYTYA